MTGIAQVAIEDGAVKTLKPTTSDPIAQTEVERAFALLEQSSLGYCAKSKIRGAIGDIVAALNAQKEKTSSLQDSLLEAVLDNQELQSAVADVQGVAYDRLEKIGELQFQVALAQQNEERIRQNAIEGERTIVALTRLTPAEFNAAANAFTAVVELTTAVGMSSDDPIGFAMKLDAAGVPGPQTFEELSRRFREMAIAVDRANAGVAVPR